MSEQQATKPRRATPLAPRQRAILVGASSGIGAALARRLAKEGWTLALLARRTDRLAALCEEINACAGEVQAIYYEHDVTHCKDVPALLQKVLADLGGLDLFIYNSGITPPINLEHYHYEQDTEVNYIGALAWLNPVATLFQSLQAGQIVGISSVAGDRGRVGNPAYNASKAALTCYLEALRNRLARTGVHVLTVKPGLVATELNQGKKRSLLTIPAEKAARDIAWAIKKKKQVKYTPWFWRMIMLLIQHTPSVIFRRLSI
jgi:decaprenylphospho-beta-D-erythro-pentofuranosid-2-ulose 2-reductase